jgi:hypothetical protein
MWLTDTRRESVRIPKELTMVPRSLMLKLTNPPAHESHDVIDARYWLVHGDGYRVDGPDGRIGTVMRTIEGSDTLVIRTGLLGTHSVAVRFEDVDAIEPWDERLTLRADPRHPASRARPAGIAHSQRRSRAELEHPAA